MQRIVLANTTWPDVDKKSCGGESMGPEPRRDVRMEQEGTDAVAESAKYAVCPPVLLRGIRTC